MADSHRKYDDDYAAHFRKLLRQFCEENGGQLKAAPRLGTTQATLSRVLGGQQPQLKLIIAVARELGLTLDQVTGYTVATAADVASMQEQMARLQQQMAAMAEQLAAATGPRRQSSHVRNRR